MNAHPLHLFRSMLAMVGLICFLCASPRAAWAQQEDPAAQSFYEKGKDLYQTGDYKAAHQAFSAALRIRKNFHKPQHPLILKTIWRLADTEAKLRQNDRAIALYQELLQVYGQSGTENEAEVLLDLGNTYTQAYDLEKSGQAFDRALEIYQQLHGTNSSQVGNILMNFGGNYQKMGRYRDAEKAYLSAFEIFKKVSDPNSEDFNRIYSNQGHLYRKSGDLPKSLHYAQKALEIKLKNYPANHPSVGKYHRNIGKVYQEMGDPAKALPQFELALSIIEKALGKNHASTAGAMAELAGVYADLKDYKKALSLYKKGLKTMLKTRNKTHPYVAAGYVNIAAVYGELGRPADALEYYEIARQLIISRDYVPPGILAQIEHEIADVYLSMKDLDQAMAWCNKSLQQLAPGFSPVQHADDKNPDPAMVQDNVLFINTLLTKANILAQRNKETKGLQQSLETIETALLVVEKMRKSYLSNDSRLYLRSESIGIYRKAVELCFLLFKRTEQPSYFWKALNYVDQSHASVLRQSLQDAVALESSGVPESLLQQLAQLGAQIAQLESQSAEGPAEQLEIARRLNDLQLQHLALIEGLEINYPKYYALKYGAKPLDPSQVQKSLPDAQTALCTYFYDDTHVYIFVVKKSSISAQKHVFGPKAIQAIRDIRNFDPQSLMGPGRDEAQGKYIGNLSLLHEILIQPIEADLKGSQKLLIVANGVLQYLPFEILAHAKAGQSFRDLPYLLRAHRIQYLWSIELWMNSTNEYPAVALPMLAMAPSFGQKNDASSITANERALLTALPFSQEEAAMAIQYFRGEALTGDAASKAAFLAKAPDCRILHLATHALANDQQPHLSGLYFSPGDGTDSDYMLHLSELYQMKLQAEMVLISACNTGFGQIAEGEGVLSLGRGFRYAGAKSIFMNLWPANDRAAASLMALFYKNLAAGQAKDQALQNAKLAFLEKSDPLTAHPFYWAGLVGVGDNAAITVESNISGAGQFLLILLGLLVLFMLFKYLRPTS